MAVTSMLRSALTYPVRYDCHINVEICASVKAIKYIHKYIYKGHDRATLEMGGDIDEILEHINSRYIGPPEGCWHIFEFPLHEEKPSVYRLPVHEEDQQMVYFDDDDDAEELMGRNSIKKTHLTEWFTANRNLEGAKVVSYQDFPQAFTWNKKTKKWNIRRQCDVIGRMYFVHPSAGEHFYLRMLLTTVKGPESWEHLRTFNGEVHPNYKEACLARGLLEDDGEWNQCLQEAGNMQSGHQLHSLFAIMLIWCKPL